MTGDVLITVVIPTFGSSDLAARAIHSAIAQRGVSMTIIISDDSIGDEIETLRDVLAGLTDRLIYLRGPRSGNPVDNWNFGISSASTKYVVLLHHDEFFIDNSYLARAVEYLEREGRAAVIAKCTTIDVDRRSKYRIANAIAKKFKLPLWTLFLANWIGPTACLVARSDKLFFDPRLQNLVDVECYFRVFSEDGLSFIAGACVASLAHHDRQISARIDRNRVSIREIEDTLVSGRLTSRQLYFIKKISSMREWKL